MAFSEALATRVRALISDHPAYSERKMFGGLCCMIGGHMACGILGDDLMLRLDKGKVADLLAEPHTRPMDFTGRPMPSMLFVGPEGTRSSVQLRRWVDRAREHAEGLPPK